MNVEKNNTVTYVKAIGITLMVLAHAMTPLTIGWNAIYAFHMPLFFLMSGYCFKERYLDDAKQFVVRKIKGIYVPFVLFALPFLALHNVFCSWYFYEPDWLYGWKDFAWNAGRIITRMSMNEGLLGTFWFLKELFWGSLIFYAVLRLVKRLKGEWMKGLRAEWITAIGMFACAEVMSITKIHVPYFMITYNTFYVAFFIACGYLWKVKELERERVRELENERAREFGNERARELESEGVRELGIRGRWWLYVLGIGAMVAELTWSPQIGMLGNTPLSLVYYTIPAIGTTMMVFYGCRWMENYLPDAIGKVVQFVGDHSLSIMALHFTAFKLVSLVLIKIHHLPIERLVEFPVVRECANAGGGVILYTFVGVCTPLICVWIWQRGSESVKG